MSGLNATDPTADSVHGTNPQNLVEKITRLKVYNSQYWKEQCFGLTSELLVDKAIALKYIGGTYAGNNKPTPFLCLVLKLLQLQPEREIILEYIRNDEFKYLRALGAFYLRLTGKAEEIYNYLEPLLNDYRKLIHRDLKGWEVTYMDVFVDQLLHEELVCDISLPHLSKRHKLEDLGVLSPRKSILEDEFNEQNFQESLTSLMEEAKKPHQQQFRSSADSSQMGDSGCRHSDPELRHDDKNRRSRSHSPEPDRHQGTGRRERSRSRSRSPVVESSSRDTRREDSIRPPGPRPLASSKKFDRIFGKNKQGGSSASSKGTDAPEGSVEYWNQMREKLGLKKLKD